MYLSSVVTARIRGAARWRHRIAHATALALRLLIGTVFIVAGLSKLLNSTVFAKTLSGYGFLPAALIGPVALFFPLAEIIFGSLFAIGLRPALLGGIAICILVGFSLMAFAQSEGGVVDCGCFPIGDGAESSVLFFLVRNSLLAVAALWVVIESKKLEVR